MIGFHLPKPISNWDPTAAGQILSRTLFGFTQQDITFALSLKQDEFRENNLLAVLPGSNTPAVWITEKLVANNTKVDKPIFTNVFSALHKSLPISVQIY